MSNRKAISIATIDPKINAFYSFPSAKASARRTRQWRQTDAKKTACRMKQLAGVNAMDFGPQ